MMKVVVLMYLLFTSFATSIRLPQSLRDVQAKQNQEVRVTESHGVAWIKYEQVEGKTMKFFPHQRQLHAYETHEEADIVRDTKDKVMGTVRDVALGTKDKLKDMAKEALDTGNTLQRDVMRNSTEECKIIRRYVVDILSYLLSSELWASGGMKLLGLSVAYGTVVWVTFFSSYVMTDTLTRQQITVVQSKIYPIYFRVMAFSIGILLLSHSLSSGKRLSSGRTHFLQAVNLFVSFLLVLFTLKHYKPRVNKSVKLEKEEGGGSSILKKLKNSYWTLLNIITLVSLTCHLVYLGHIIHA